MQYYFKEHAAEYRQTFKGQGKDWPKLQPASAKVYGKQVGMNWILQPRSHSQWRQMVFIQPDSTQPCLLGMNALGLIDCKSVPARASFFIEAKVESEKMHGTNILFEPDPKLEAGTSLDGSTAWKIAQSHITTAQHHQKKTYDRHSKIESWSACFSSHA